MRGREKPDGKGWQDMTGYRVPPLKLTAYVQYKPTLDWSNRLQATFFDGKDYRLDGLDSFGRHQVSTYTTVDLVSQYQISPTIRSASASRTCSTVTTTRSTANCCAITTTPATCRHPALC